MSSTSPGRAVDRTVIEFLVSHAVLAISGDNSQPWKFYWDGRTLRAEGDLNRGFFCLDSMGESILMALGAAFENIRIAASTLGFVLSWRLAGPHAAEFEFQHCAAAADPLFESIKKRCVNRRFYDRRPLDESSKQALKALQMPPGLELHLIERGREYDLLTELVAIADGFVFSEKPMYDVLMRWVRFSDDAPDGMPIATLGLSAHERAAFPILKNWKLVSFMNALGLAATFRSRARRLMKSSSAVCLVSLNEKTPANYFAAGMMFQRLWLTAQQAGLALQPMSASVFIISKYRSDRLAGSSNQIRSAGEKMSQNFETLLGGRMPAVLVRLGYAAAPPARSNRRPLAEIIQFADGKQ